MLKGSLIIGQSGGPSPVINSSAYGVIRTALDAECITKVYGAYHGIKGCGAAAGDFRGRSDLDGGESNHFR